MAIDVPSFLTAFPEFKDAPQSLLEAQLAYAKQMVPDAVWGQAGPDNSLTELGTFLYCAKFLALSPYARHMNLVKDDGVTTLYDARLKQVQRAVSSGFRVL